LVHGISLTTSCGVAVTALAATGTKTREKPKYMTATIIKTPPTTAPMAIPMIAPVLRLDDDDDDADATPVDEEEELEEDEELLVSPPGDVSPDGI
jgi:hypothetical protein